MEGLVSTGATVAAARLARDELRNCRRCTGNAPAQEWNLRPSWTTGGGPALELATLQFRLMLLDVAAAVPLSR
ncbi:MAG: hypothetical protein ACLQVM_04275 [Terriglobia bacterium]